MTQIAEPSSARVWLESYVSDAAYRCDNSECGRFSVVTWYTPYDPTESYRSGEPESHDRRVVWSPPPTRQPDYPDVPPHIAYAAREAWKAYALDAFIATCAVARSVIEAAAKHKKVTIRGIEAKIDELAAQQLIWGDLLDSAHIVRQFGNDAAHGDISQPPTQQEAQDVLAIVDELLHQLFTSPARSERLRQDRAERRG